MVVFLRFRSTLSVSRDSPLTSYIAEQVDMKHMPTSSRPNCKTSNTKPHAQHSPPKSLIVSFSRDAGDARHFLNSIWHRQRSGLNYQMRVILNDIHPMAMARLIVFFLQVSPTLILLTRCRCCDASHIVCSCAAYPSTRPVLQTLSTSHSLTVSSLFTPSCSRVSCAPSNNAQKIPTTTCPNFRFFVS